MSLLTEQMNDCVYLNKQVVDDGYGSQISSWTEGARFKAAVVLYNSVEAKIAEKQGVTSLYQVTTSKDIRLEYHDVFKVLESGQVFRVTSNDRATPDSATLDMRVVSAEKWGLPNG